MRADLFHSIRTMTALVQSPKSKVKEPRTSNLEPRTSDLEPRTSDRGFTLLELLVATVILGILLTALYGSFSRTLRGKVQAENRSALSRAARTTLLRIAQDLQGSFVLPSTSGTLHLVSEDRSHGSLPQDTLTFFSFAYQPLSTGGREADQCWIHYFIERHAQDSHSARLMRQVSPAPNPGPADGFTPSEQAFPLLERINGLRFRFFDGKQWVEEWGKSQLTATLPRAVEITLYLADSLARVKEFSTVVDLPLAGVTQTQAAFSSQLSAVSFRPAEP